MVRPPHLTWEKHVINPPHHGDGRGRRGWRPTAVSAATGAFLIGATACSGAAPPTGAGAASAEEAVAAYVSALNTDDAHALADLAWQQNPELATAVDSLLATRGGRDLRVTSQDIQSPVPTNPRSPPVHGPPHRHHPHRGRSERADHHIHHQALPQPPRRPLVRQPRSPGTGQLPAAPADSGNPTPHAMSDTRPRRARRLRIPPSSSLADQPESRLTTAHHRDDEAARPAGSRSTPWRGRAMSNPRSTPSPSTASRG
ncbi:hypothetical protein CLV40_113159 [Actinokineospora auranticolor]|uniref:Uncharacterized protein n=1 Tax=Actinokineospora auranticolor TaxID=155976 RepID=A0A2S6GKD3_9PSEU|nr:hypothetical protein CLV40_113159 [Actinokineospora auranticolor]